MNLITAVNKLNSLSKDELKHCIQMCQWEIDNYEQVSKNYNFAKMQKFGIPHMTKLKERKKQFEERYESICQNQ